MKKLFQWGTGLLATVPGVTVLLANLGVPPTYKWLFGTLVEVFGVFVLLTLLLFQPNLLRVRKYRLTQWATVSLAGFFVFLSCYLFLYDRTLVTAKINPVYIRYGPVYFPLWLNGDLKERVDKTSREDVIEELSPEAIEAAIIKDPSMSAAKFWTTLILLVIFIGTFTFLTLAFGLYGMRVSPPPTGSS